MALGVCADPYSLCGVFRVYVALGLARSCAADGADRAVRWGAGRGAALQRPTGRRSRARPRRRRFRNPHPLMELMEQGGWGFQVSPGFTRAAAQVRLPGSSPDPSPPWNPPWLRDACGTLRLLRSFRSGVWGGRGGGGGGGAPQQPACTSNPPPNLYPAPTASPACRTRGPPRSPAAGRTTCSPGLRARTSPGALRFTVIKILQPLKRCTRVG
jgi:hypothetical protein